MNKVQLNQENQELRIRLAMSIQREAIANRRVCELDRDRAALHRKIAAIRWPIWRRAGLAIRAFFRREGGAK